MTGAHLAQPLAPPYASFLLTAATPVTGHATSHAGEIIQGALRTHGRTRRVLLSLPAPVFWTRAEIVATPGRPLTVSPPWCAKAAYAVREFCRRSRLALPEAAVRLTTNIPVGKGCGSSTSDVLAALRALLSYCGRAVSEETLAQFVVHVEQASDSSVLSRPAIFRHREGRVEEYLPGAFPPMRVIVIDGQPTEVVDTLALRRARYSHAELAEFERLICELRQAFRDRDPARLGRVATASAQVSQSFLPKPHLGALIDLVRSCRGYGLAASHSGTVIAALMPIDVPKALEVHLMRCVEALGLRIITRYWLGGDPAQLESAVASRSPESRAR